jgi:hypothetical protein
MLSAAADADLLEIITTIWLLRLWVECFPESGLL